MKWSQIWVFWCFISVPKYAYCARLWWVGDRLEYFVQCQHLFTVFFTDESVTDLSVLALDFSFLWKFNFVWFQWISCSLLSRCLISCFDVDILFFCSSVIDLIPIRGFATCFLISATFCVFFAKLLLCWNWGGMGDFATWFLVSVPKFVHCVRLWWISARFEGFVCLICHLCEVFFVILARLFFSIEFMVWVFGY